jgi:hypothetical protein
MAPDRRTAPAAGSAIPAMMRIRVDLPEPLRPTSPTRSAPIDRLRSLKRTWRSGVWAEMESSVRNADMGNREIGRNKTASDVHPVVHGATPIQ